MTDQRLAITGLCKSFVLHNQGGLRLPVLRDINLTIGAGECVVLQGPSGVGKSTLLRIIYGNYLAEQGHIHVRHGPAMVDVATAPPRAMLDVRRLTISFVSQFLRVIPRVSALEIVAEPLARMGRPSAEALKRAALLLERLNIPRRLWSLPPATFSGGEQQRVNIARGLIAEHPILLLDEPTAALDADNRRVVTAVIDEARRRGGTILGIFHDREVRDAVATRRFPMPRLEATA